MTAEQSPLSYQIVASDLDGTLLAPDHKLSEKTKHTLKKLHERGYTFIFATGRHHVDVAGIRNTVGIPAYMITSNGARVHTPDNQLMSSQNIPEHLVQPVVDMLKNEHSIYVHIYRDQTWHLNKDKDALENFHNESGFSFNTFHSDDAPTDNVAKVFFTDLQKDHEHLRIFEQRLNDTFGEQLTICFSSPWCLEVMGPNVSKGNAIKTVSESLGLGLQDCIAFGDGMNDVEMLSMAGKGLLMGTAHPQVIEAIPTIERIGSNEHDAVAQYLEDNLLK
ncbi:Cof-type HAD-IIB family hydrolase [Vibrio palustris]|uniref:Pyridoxal phosphate phosphatase YigL n=1 Tax=Vibrio palustris TaxID=1918946 RepID=A0A1R4B870_9VIBR|nr:Cof-type HAD-IIB family hydrolase [Vibrio palustris]SJL85086.1 Pyridoxal phosphate phosphatase YigL [Vibrio palustris]